MSTDIRKIVSSVCHACCRLSVVDLEGYKMELNELEKTIVELTLQSVDMRKENIRWLAKQNSLMLYEIFKLKKNHFHKLKSSGVITDLILLDMVVFLFAVKELLESTELQNKKNPSYDLTGLRKIARNQAKKFKKVRKTPKRDLLMNMQNNIITWIEAGTSDRGIADLILQTKKIQISHTEISRFHQALKKQKYVEK